MLWLSSWRVPRDCLQRSSVGARCRSLDMFVQQAKNNETKVKEFITIVELLKNVKGCKIKGIPELYKDHKFWGRCFPLPNQAFRIPRPQIAKKVSRIYPGSHKGLLDELKSRYQGIANLESTPELCWRLEHHLPLC